MGDLQVIADLPGPDAASAPLTVGLLGPLRIVDVQGHEVDLMQDKVRLTFARLALAGGDTVTVDELIASLWERPPASARKTLHGYVARLRRRLGNHVVLTRPGGYALAPGAIRTDVELLSTLLACADAAVGGVLGDHLDSALGLFRDDPLTGLDSARLQRRFGDPLRELRIDVLQRWATHWQALTPLPVMARLTVELTDEPYREGLWATLIRAQLAAGLRSEALRTYQRARRRLVDDLGLEPGAELVAAHRAALVSTVGAGPAVSAVLDASGRSDGSGKDDAEQADELERLHALLHIAYGERAGAIGPVVVSGLPGAGRTHLARRVAAEPGDVVAGAELVRCGVATTGAGLAADVVNAARRVRSRVSADPRPVLILVDEVEDPSQLTRIPAVAPSAVVVVFASSVRLAALATHHLRLDAWPRRRVETELRTVAGEAAWTRDFDAARQLMELCEGFPVAVRAVADRLAADPMRNIAALVRELGDPQRRLDGMDSADVRGHLRRRYDRCGEAARAAYRLVAHLQAQQVTADVLAASLAIGVASARDALDELADRDLMTRVRSRGSDTDYGMLRLARLHGRELGEHEDDPLQRDLAVRRALESLRLRDQGRSQTRRALDAWATGSLPTLLR